MLQTPLKISFDPELKKKECKMFDERLISFICFCVSISYLYPKFLRPHDYQGLLWDTQTSTNSVIGITVSANDRPRKRFSRRNKWRDFLQITVSMQVNILDSRAFLCLHVYQGHFVQMQGHDRKKNVWSILGLKITANFK